MLRASLKYVAIGLLCYTAGLLEGYLEELGQPVAVDEQKQLIKNSALTEIANNSSRPVRVKNTPSPIQTEKPSPLLTNRTTSIDIALTDDNFNRPIYVIPPADQEVDRMPLQRVMAAFPEGRDAGRKAVLGGNATCQITSKIIIHRNDLDSLWTLSTLDPHGKGKYIGGDEYYITYTPDGSKEPSAIANITDWSTGTYSFHFVGSPTTTLNAAAAQPRGTLKVILEHSCGMGALSPPLKQNWSTSGAINRIYTIRNVPAPKTIQPFVQPNADGRIDFEEFDQIVFLGDSTMGQLACPDVLVPNLCQCAPFRPNIYHACQIASGLNNKTLKSFQTQARQDLLEAKQIARGKYASSNRQDRNRKPRLGIVVGSGVWDVLSEDVDFADHLEACRQFVQSLQQDHPKVTIFWKSMTAMHIHAVATSEHWERIRRVYYMSNTRARKLDQLQKALMKELGVTLLDLFDATYFAAHKTKEGDGRHYEASFNQLMNSWFYPRG